METRPSWECYEMRANDWAQQLQERLKDDDAFHKRIDEMFETLVYEGNSDVAWATLHLFVRESGYEFPINPRKLNKFFEFHEKFSDYCLNPPASGRRQFNKTSVQV